MLTIFPELLQDSTNKLPAMQLKADMSHLWPTTIKSLNYTFSTPAQAELDIISTPA